MCAIVIIALDNLLSLEILIYILVLKKLRGLKIKFLGYINSDLLLNRVSISEKGPSSFLPYLALSGLCSLSHRNS